MLRPETARNLSSWTGYVKTPSFERAGSRLEGPRDGILTQQKHGRIFVVKTALEWFWFVQPKAQPPIGCKQYRTRLARPACVPGFRKGATTPDLRRLSESLRGRLRGLTSLLSLSSTDWLACSMLSEPPATPGAVGSTLDCFGRMQPFVLKLARITISLLPYTKCT
jgi:hypothetical protein